MAKRLGPDYQGILIKRLPATGMLAHPAVRPADQVIRQAKQDFTERLCALFQFYQIDRTEPEEGWFRLAVCLAVNHVPGFQPEPRGRQTWDEQREATLYNEVTAWLAKGEGQTINGACYHLANQEAYKEFLGSSSSHEARTETLRSRYHKVRNKYGPIAEYDKKEIASHRRPPPVRIIKRDEVIAPSMMAATDKLIDEAQEAKSSTAFDALVDEIKEALSPKK